MVVSELAQKGDRGAQTGVWGMGGGRGKFLNNICSCKNCCVQGSQAVIWVGVCGVCMEGVGLGELFDEGWVVENPFCDFFGWVFSRFSDLD